MGGPEWPTRAAAHPNRTIEVIKPRRCHSAWMSQQIGNQGPYAPVPPKKKSNVGLIVGIVVGAVVLFCGGLITVALIGLNTTPTAGDTPTGAAGIEGAEPGVPDSGQATAPPPKGAGMNQPVRDGKFEFTVTKVQCGQAKVGSEFLNKTAQGQFCLVSVTVKNIGDEARTLDSSSQYAYNAAGQKYDADGEAGIYLDDSNTFLNSINPGNSVKGIVVFDIPKDAKIVRVELHDSLFSGGVAVTVA